MPPVRRGPCAKKGRVYVRRTKYTRNGKTVRRRAMCRAKAKLCYAEDGKRTKCRRKVPRATMVRHKKGAVMNLP